MIEIGVSQRLRVDEMKILTLHFSEELYEWRHHRSINKSAIWSKHMDCYIEVLNVPLNT